MRRLEARHVFIGVAALLLVATAATAQVTTGSVSGVVTSSEDNGALPGVQISATHIPTGTTYNGICDINGKFRILNVRVGGPYMVSATMDTFHPQQANNVFVRLGEDTFLAFDLQPASFEETLVVVSEASPIINLSRTGSTSNVDALALETLPTVRRSLDEFARTNPMFTVSSENEDPDAISAGGRNAQYNNIAIDGSVNNDLFGLSDGGTPGGQSGTTPISLDAIQEVELVISSFDVRQGGFTGGGINAITRSGSNDYHGSVFFYTRDSNFYGDGPDELGGELRGIEEEQYGFRLGGPIIEDKLFFFVNADLEDRSNPSGWSLDGSSGQAFADGELVDEANTFRSFLIDNYGFDPGGLSEQILDDPSDKFFARLDYNINQSNNLTFRHNMIDAGRDINRPGSYTYEWDSEGYDFQTKTNSTVMQLNSTLSNTTFNEFRIAYQTIRDRRAGMGDMAFPWIEIEDVNGSASGRNEFEAGTEPYSTRNSLDQDILEIHNDFTWIKGDHTITFGTHNEFFGFNNLFIQNAFGSYEFSSLEDFLAGDVRNFRYTVVPDGQPAAQKFDVMQLGFYAGDQWAAKGNLTLTYGLRVDVPLFPDKPTRNPLTEDLYGVRTDNIPDGEQLWQPRLGFNWDPEANGESQLRGGAGIFAGRAPYVWISNNYARTGVEQLFIQCSGDAVPDFNPDPFNQSAECGLAGGAVGEFNLIDPSFKLPTVLRLNLGYDRHLPWWDLVGSIEAVYTDSRHEIDYQNLNIAQTGELTFDGRPVYEDVDSGVDGAYYITNTGQGKATQIALKVQRPFRDGLWGFVSYAWTDSKVVNEGTSSRAVSNWSYQEAIDPNNVSLSRSDYEVEHRFNAALSYQFNRDSRYPTTASLFYNLQAGRPFSYLAGSDWYNWNFGASVNGDGTDGNDLFWVPESENDVIIVGGGTWDQLDAFIRSQPELANYRGRIAKRNIGKAPWHHSLDLHLSQEIPIGNSSFEITFDILNLINLIDENSGLLRYVNFNSIEVVEIEGVCGDSIGDHSACGPGDAGKVVYSLSNTAQGDDELFQIHNINSRWRAKLGIRFSF